MHIFLTGGTGFVGSYFLQAALLAGHKVTALRRPCTSKSQISLSQELCWCEADLSTVDSSHIESVDILVHLASAGVSPKPATWSELVQTNVCGTMHLFEQAVEAGVRRFVVAGTSHEYGNSARIYKAIPPDAPLEPLTPYGASKAAAFQMMRTFAMLTGIELFYGRIFHSYGNGQFEGNFWASLFRAALDGNDFPMTTGRQIMDFIPISDVTQHLLTACTRIDISPGNPFVVNIGSGVPKTLLSFAQSEWCRLNASGRLLPGHLPDRPNQIERCVADLHCLDPFVPKPSNNLR